MALKSLVLQLGPTTRLSISFDLDHPFNISKVFAFAGGSVLREHDLPKQEPVYQLIIRSFRPNLDIEWKYAVCGFPQRDLL